MPKRSFTTLPVRPRDVLVQPDSRAVVIPELSFITNGLRVAAERFRDDVKTFQEVARQVPEPGKVAFITPAAARSLAVQFERQAVQMDDLIRLLDRADSIAVLDIGEDDDEEEED